MLEQSLVYLSPSPLGTPKNQQEYQHMPLTDAKIRALHGKALKGEIVGKAADVEV